MMADLTKDTRKLALVNLTSSTARQGRPSDYAGTEQDPKHTLEGATDRGEPNAYARDAGEFAARWNAASEEQREDRVRWMVKSSQDAAACFERDHEGRIEWLELQLRKRGAQVVELQAALVVAGRAAVLDYVRTKEVAKVKVEFTNQPIFDQVIADARREGGIQALDALEKTIAAADIRYPGKLIATMLAELRKGGE